MMTMILIILGVALFLAIMLLTIILPFKPNSLTIFGKMVCSGDEKMEILTSVASYHRPGERSISIYCNDYGKRRDVKGKTLLLSFIFSFVSMLPFAILIVVLIYKFIG